MVVHTIGDSHSHFGWDGIDVEKHWIPNKLCFSVGRDGLDLKKFNIKNKDTVIFCFGEIDCRCQIHKRINDSKDFVEIIDFIVENYLLKIKLSTENMDLKIAIFNVVPPVQRHNTQENKELPFLGTDEERKMYVLYFNKKLKEISKQYNYIFFDVYDKYCDANGFLNKSLSDGNVHIRNGIHIKEFVKMITNTPS